MLHFMDVTISVESLKKDPVSPGIVQILRLIRPEWETGNIHGKVRTAPGVSRARTWYWYAAGPPHTHPINVYCNMGKVYL